MESRRNGEGKQNDEPVQTTNEESNNKHIEKQEDEEDGHDVCAICLSDLNLSNHLELIRPKEIDKSTTVACLSSCTHQFHVECIEAWLAISATCPLCKVNIERVLCFLAKDWSQQSKSEDEDADEKDSNSRMCQVCCRPEYFNPLNLCDSGGQILSCKGCTTGGCNVSIHRSCIDVTDDDHTSNDWCCTECLSMQKNMHVRRSRIINSQQTSLLLGKYLERNVTSSSSGPGMDHKHGENLSNDSDKSMGVWLSRDYHQAHSPYNKNCRENTESSSQYRNIYTARDECNSSRLRGLMKIRFLRDRTKKRVPTSRRTSKSSTDLLQEITYELEE